MADQNANPQELSEEQLAQKREEITQFYTENVEHLKIQLEYENLLRDIEKARAERIQAQVYIAQAMAQRQAEVSNQVPPIPGSNNNVDKGEVSKRKLKKVADEV
tara:strand:+ start:7122 stop:7433 length:312 start_codon:yes stop_codon:yes gene_type:complete